MGQTTSLRSRLLQRLHYLLSRHRSICFQAHTFPRELIHSCENTERTPVCQLVTHEIHTPTLVPTARSWCRNALPSADLSSLLGADNQSLFRVEAIDALGIYLPT